MSTKLNAEELALKRYESGYLPTWNPTHGYAAAIREVAQPIADQRDELLEALKASHEALDRLFARLIEADDGFFPTQSGQPWQAMLKVHAAITKATTP
jgi:hypothetical protein